MKRVILISLLMLMAAIVWADAMPDFRLQDMNGKNVALESLLGKGPILIDFWADYCKPCKEAMPLLNELAIKYDSLTVVLSPSTIPKSRTAPRTISSRTSSSSSPSSIPIRAWPKSSTWASRLIPSFSIPQARSCTPTRVSTPA